MGYRKDEMETELEKGVNGCYEICTGLRRTMKTMTRERYRQVVIILRRRLLSETKYNDRPVAGRSLFLL